MVDKPCQPCHNLIRDLINELNAYCKLGDGEYGMLMDYVNDCECLLDPKRDDCNDKERR